MEEGGLPPSSINKGEPIEGSPLLKKLQTKKK